MNIFTMDFILDKLQVWMYVCNDLYLLQLANKIVQLKCGTIKIINVF